MRLPMLVVVVGCGSPDPAMQDAAVDTATADAAVDATPGPCDLTKPFTNAQPIAELNTPDDELYGWLSDDELTLYFTRGPVTGSDRDIWFATRNALTDPFNNAAVLPGVNTVDREERPIVSSDGKTLYADNVTSILIATRAAVTDDFGVLAPLTQVSSPSSDISPWVSRDGFTMYLASNRDRADTANFDIYRASRTDVTQPFGTPVAITALNGTAFDAIPVRSDDGLEVFFETQRGPGGTQIYRATRASDTAIFGAPVPVTELNTAGLDSPSWLSPDRCRLMFARSGTNGLDLWMAERPD